MNIILKNNFDKLIVNFNENKEQPAYLSCVIFQNNELENNQTIQPLCYSNFAPRQEKYLTMKIKAPNKEGDFDFLIGINNGLLPTGLNSNYFHLKVN